MQLSPMHILIGLVPVIGIGAGYFFLGPLKNMFKNFGKEKKHKEKQLAGEANVKELSGKSAEVVARIKNIEKAEKITKQKIKDEVEASQARIEEIVKSDKTLTDLATDFDKEW
jgi:flagellar motor component MotA